MIRLVLTMTFGFLIVSCGVKGDPLPPEEPAQIGRGHPTYRKAAERFEIRTEATEEEKAKEKEEED